MRNASPSNRARLARIRLNAEQLEDRSVPAALTFVNDTWHLFQDVDVSGTVTLNDLVSNGNDPGSGPLTVYAYGVQAFGTVTSGPFTGPGSLPAYDNINDAIANTDIGGTLSVLGGSYNESVSVSKTLTLLGAQAGVDARTRTGVPESIVGSTNGAFQFTANNIVLDGFTVSGVTGGLNAGVSAGGVAGYQIRNNIITNNVIGVFANASGASLIESNLFDGNNNPGPSGGAGIYSDSSTGLTIDDNEFVNHTVNNPILLAATGPGSHTGVTVTNNFIHDNVSGVFALGINGGLFQGNTITTGGTATALTFGGANTAIDVLNNDLSGNLRGLRIADYGFLGVTPNSDIEAHFNSFANNTVYGAGISDEGSGLTDGYTGALDLTANWWGDVTGPTSAANPGGTGSALRNDFADTIDFQPWLLYGDDNSAQVGFQIPISFTVNAQTSGFTATNNNYRRLVNAFDPLQPGQTMTLAGNFDWTEANAAASWALGNDGVISAADDYSILVVPNINDVTVTAASLGAATIQGPGDVATANLEGFLVFDGGDNQNWTISNLAILDFDLSIGMFNGAGGVDAYNGTTITNNRIRLANDLNATVAPADVNQNIGIHYSFGTNQTISNNLIEIPGDGVSAGTNLSSMVGMQSNTSGGNVYNGLLIDNNTINVIGAQSANPSRVLGIWENAHAHTSNITVSNNDFVNLSAGNDAALNLQRAFRVTSHSGATTTVTYSGNTVNGANIGFEWLSGQNFSGNQPVVLTGNTLTGVQTGFLIQSNGLATFTGSNSVTGTPTGTGIDVRTGSIVSVLGGSFTNTGVGIDVTGGTALIQGANLNTNAIAGLRVQGGAKVDAGDTSSSNSTGLGSSTGGNDFSSYLPAGPGRAIQNLNTDTASVGFVAAPPDMRAQGNTFASPSLSFIEQVVDHDVDVPTQGFVDFSNPQAGTNDAPVAVDDIATTNEDTALVLTQADLKGNDTDVDNSNAQLSVTAVTNATNGSVVLNGDGTITFTPAPNFNGTAGFDYTLSDGSLTDVGHVTITVTPVNDAPVAVAGTLTATEDVGTTGTLVATDVDSPTLIYSIVDQSDAHGVVTITNAATGAYTYTPDLNYNGPASFTFKANDGTADSNTATVTITVTAVNDAPVVNNQSFPVTENSPNGTVVGSVVASDVDGPALIYSISSGNTGGAFAINPATGQITVANSAALDFETNPVFSLTVQVTDGSLSDTALVTIVLNNAIEVQPPIIAPVAVTVPLFAVGADAGANAHVKVYNADSSLRFSFMAFPGFNGGVRVATGDVNNDGVEDIVVGAGAGANGGHVKVFDGATGAEIASFFSFVGYTGAVDVAVGNVDNDNDGDIIVGSFTDSSHVKAFDFATGANIMSFFAYPGYAGGITVSAGNFDGVGGDEVITGTASAASHVKAFNGGGQAVASFIAPGGNSGIDVAAGLLNGDNFAEILVSSLTGNNPVQVFAGGTAAPAGSFDAGFSGNSNGLRVATGNANGTAGDEILVSAGPGTNAVVRVFNPSSLSQISSFTAFDGYLGGVFIG